MKNDSYDRAREKARQKRVKKRVEFLDTPLREKIDKGPIMTQLKSMKELAEEIHELIGKKK